MSRRNFGTIKSLLHFDFPYFNEPDDGLGDEIGLEAWTKSGSVALYGSSIPKAGTIAPKFGYRCLYTNKSSILCSNSSGIWNLRSEGSYEIGMFVRITQTAAAKSIFSLMDADKSAAVLSLSLAAGGLLSFVSSGFEVSSVSGSTVMSANVWHHVLLRISGGRVRVFLDGKLEILSVLSSGKSLDAGQAVIGNSSTAYPVYIDEFMFRHSVNSC